MRDKPFCFKLLKFIPFVLPLLGGSGPLWAQASETLDEIVVTASRAQESKREVSSNVTVIGAEEIKASTASTVADLMVSHGFLVTTTGDESNVQIRGFGNRTMNTEAENTVLTLINGRRVGNANLSIAGLANVERIEIIRGPAAVQYGSSAMGGVINIITRRGKEGKPNVSIEAGLGSDDLKREKIALSGASGGFDYALGLTNFSHDDVTTSGGRRWYHTDVDHNTAANVDLGYTFGKNHRVGVNYNMGDVKSHLTSGSGGIRTLGGNTATSAYSSYNKRNHNTALTYTGNTDDKVFDWSASYSFGRDDKEYRSSGYTNTVKNEIFNAQGGYNGELFSLSAGVDRLEYRNSRTDQTTRTSMQDTGVYLTGRLRLLDEKLIFSAGGRYDKYTNDGNRIEKQRDDNVGGSVGVAWLPVNWLKLRANYAEGFKMPSPRQVGGDGRNYNPNDGLLPEKSKSWEVGVDVNWQYVSGGLTYFHSDWKNKIVSQSVVGMPYGYQYRNVKDATLAGVEGNLSVDIGKALHQDFSLSPYANFTWLETRKNKDKSQFITYHGHLEDTLDNTPEWMASYGVSYSHPACKLKSAISANYYGTLITRDWSQSGSPYFRRPAGTVVNWSVEKELSQLSDQFGKVTLRAEVNNLFDADNEMYWGYPGAGRSFYLELRVDF
jgi:vitamin B12 transporter